MWAARSLFCFCGGTPPTAPARGLCPLDPGCPPPLAQGLPGFWVPLVARLLMWATRSYFEFVGGHPPQPPARGLCPPWTPVCPPPLAEGLPVFWVPPVAGLLIWATLPLVLFWGHIPHGPLPGGFAPLDPLLPTPAGFGFARVLGPTRGGVAKVGYSPPLLVSWGDTPHSPPPGGLRPPGPPVFPPPLA